KQAHPRTQQVDRFGKPVTVFFAGVASTARGPLWLRPFFLPEPAALQLGFDFGEQILDGQLLQILRVEPFEFGAIENAIRAADTLERKFFEQLRGAQKLFVAAGGPAEQREKIAKGLRKKAFGAVHVDVGGAVTLGKARLVWAKDERDVREDGRLDTEGAIEQDLLRRVGDVVGATNHVGDAHVDVVNDDDELVH